jgi:Tol biopolymer transport system component
VAVVVAASLAVAVAGRAEASAAKTLDPVALAADFQRHVAVLAAEDMEGRGLGTEGLGRAADYIEGRLRAAGLKPAFGDAYRQPFRVKAGVALAPAGADGTPANVLEGVAAEDWTPLGMSSSAAFTGELAFAGYGIEAPPVGYRELEGMDVAGKVVLMLRYEPQEKDDASPFDGRRPSRYSALRYKALQARERGAAAVVFVTGPAQDDGKDRLPALKNDGPESAAGIPVLQVKLAVARQWLEPAGIDLAAFQAAVDRDLVPRSKAKTGVTVSGRVELLTNWFDAVNVAGVLPGRGRLAEEVVVLGAHYDHLGYGGRGSMRPDARAVHHGADDNASGTAAAILAAERLASVLADVPERRTFVVALFSGEETGLAGSSAFVATPPFPVAKTVAMVNLDMVGRLREDKLVALGSETAPQWNEALDRLQKPLGLQVARVGDGYGPSDQTSFYAAGIPVLHFFTGAHDEYHTPDDTAATVNAAGAARVIGLTAALVEDVARGRLNPAYKRTASGPPLAGDSRGYGAYLGTVPDYRAMEATEGGVLLSDVRAGSPADNAGIRGGDRLVGLAGTKIENLYDMTYALQDHRPGDAVDVVVVRGGQRITVRAILGERGASPAAARPAAAAASPAPASPGAPASPAAAADPHAAPPAAAAAPAGPAVDPFYQGRPGPDFTIGAGKPFAATAGEKRLADVRQLTFAGENAEPYFSPDGRRIIFQATTQPGACDQQYVMDLATGETTLVSTGRGRTTCGYFDWPEGDRIVYASTHGAGDACPAVPDRSQGYVWPIYASYDLYEAAPDGSNPRRLTDAPGYDAEATWCGRGGAMVFTSNRDGDLDLYVMDEAGATRRLTRTEGYDGGAFFSPDCKEIVWRASRPQGAALEEYRALLAKGLLRPNALEIFLMSADGSNPRALTDNGAANFCPTFHPDGTRILYSSNAGDPRGREFDIFLVDTRGGPAERVTTTGGFDGFPHFSPDGRFLVWSSNRANPAGRETNLFLARWVDSREEPRPAR